MKTQTYVFSLGILLLALLASCSSAPKVRVDKDSHADFASYKTFSWQEPADPRRTSTLVGQRVKDAIISALQSKGQQLSEAQADVRVSYVLNVYERPKQSGMRIGFGVGGGGPNGGAAVGASVPVGKNTEIAAAMTIDIIDAKRNAQVWTGSYETIVTHLDITDTEANTLVSTILAKYP
jgi:hypothetical protein